MISRRDMLKAGLAAGAASALVSRGLAATAGGTGFPITDTNISLFHWPFRRLPLDGIDVLVNRLRALGVTEAWAGSFEGILHRDQAAVNRRLAGACKGVPEFIPIGSINPELPGWEEDLRRCVEEHGMRGIRLCPNYHGYTLDGPRFARLLERATAAGCLVQIAVALEDTRTQSARLPTPDVDTTPLAAVMAKVEGARVQLLNHRGRVRGLEALAAQPGVYFDTARVDGTDGVPQFMQRVSAGRVLFGSHAPFLIPEAALIRVHESDQLDEAALTGVLSGHARAAMGKGAR